MYPGADHSLRRRYGAGRAAGQYTPAAFQNPTDSAVAVVTALILFLSGARHLLMGNQQRYDLLMLLMDSAGLGIFTVMGVRVAWHCAENPSLYLLVFVGAVTGVGGGLMRDIMAGDTPISLSSTSMPVHLWPVRCCAGCCGRPPGK